MKKLVGIGLLAVLIGIGGMFIFRDQLFFAAASEQVNEQTTITDVAHITEIEVEVDVASVRIEESHDDSIHVSLLGNISEQEKKRISLDVVESNQHLEISLKRHQGTWIRAPFFNWRGSVELVIALPEQQFSELGVSLDVGSLTVSKGQFQRLDLETNVGEINVYGTQTESSYVHADVGSIRVDDAVGAWDLSANVGAIALQVQQWHADISAQTDIGEVTVTVPVELSDYQLDVGVDLGSVQVRGFDQINQQGSKQISQQVGQNGPKLTAKADLGDVTVRTE